MVVLWCGRLHVAGNGDITTGMNTESQGTGSLFASPHEAEVKRLRSVLEAIAGLQYSHNAWEIARTALTGGATMTADRTPICEGCSALNWGNDPIPLEAVQ